MVRWWARRKLSIRLFSYMPIGDTMRKLRHFDPPRVNTVWARIAHTFSISTTALAILLSQLNNKNTKNISNSRFLFFLWIRDSLSSTLLLRLRGEIAWKTAFFVGVHLQMHPHCRGFISSTYSLLNDQLLQLLRNDIQCSSFTFN